MFMPTKLADKMWTQVIMSMLLKLADKMLVSYYVYANKTSRQNVS